MEKFRELLGRDSPLLVSVEKKGFAEPSEIQNKSIPDILKGNDVIAGAATGSGKTFAFAAGLVNNVKKGKGIQGLVLTPTRELAEQITHALTDFSKHNSLNVLAIYGGVSIDNQIRRIGTADIIVGTPGRILDHMNRGTLRFDDVNTLVLDEADRMLDMGFMMDVERIIRVCPKKRQTLLFSATISEDIVRIAQKYMNHPKEISAEQYVDPKKLKQIFYDVQDPLKFSLLKHLLENEKAGLVMIFCNTRRNVDFISKNLKLAGVEALPIHGGFSQNKRQTMLNKFHSKKVHVLVATDVAARGLDIKGVSHVYNYDIPPNVKEYMHRVGRTARAGKEGKVINIVASRDYDNFRVIMSEDFEISQEKPPYIKKVLIKWKGDRNDFRRGSGGRPDGGEKYSRDRRPYRGEDNRRGDYSREGKSYRNRDNQRGNSRGKRRY